MKILSEYLIQWMICVVDNYYREEKKNNKSIISGFNPNGNINAGLHYLENNIKVDTELTDENESI